MEAGLILLLGVLALDLAPVPAVPSPPVGQLVSPPVASALPSPAQAVLGAPAPGGSGTAALPGAAGGAAPAAAATPSAEAGRTPAPAPARTAVSMAGAAGGRAPAGRPAAMPAFAGADAVDAAGQVVQAAFDNPLGPAPPLVGLLLLALSAALAIRRRLERRAQQRALERAKMHFLKIASHELRTPLTVIRGYISMARDGTLGVLPDRMDRALPTLEEEVAQLERLVEQMLLAAQLDEGLLGLARDRLDLREVAKAALQRISPAQRGRLAAQMPPEPVPIAGDASALALVVGNLVENALKYSADDREVRLSVAAGARARLTVSDQGIGIDRDEFPLLFTRFGRIVNPANSHVFGSGLGLYLARGIARLHGGDVTAESTAGRGSSFTLELPPAVPAVRRWAGRLRAARPGPRAREAGVP